VIIIETLILTAAMLFIVRKVSDKIERWRIKKVYGRDLERGDK
jgi:hypothetical protein